MYFSIQKLQLFQHIKYSKKLQKFTTKFANKRSIKLVNCQIIFFLPVVNNVKMKQRTEGTLILGSEGKSLRKSDTFQRHWK